MGQLGIESSQSKNVSTQVGTRPEIKLPTFDSRVSIQLPRKNQELHSSPKRKKLTLPQNLNLYSIPFVETTSGQNDMFGYKLDYRRSLKKLATEQSAAGPIDGKFLRQSVLWTTSGKIGSPTQHEIWRNYRFNI